MIFIYISTSAFIGFVIGAWCRGIKAADEIQKFHKDVMGILESMGQEK